jgi:hypothetical protein
MAQGTSSAKDPRVAGLIAKVNGLQGQVNTLKAAVVALDAKSQCLKAQGAVLRGVGADEGYLYKKAGDNTNTWLFAAFDAPLQGEAPQMYFATITPTCVTSSYRGGKAPLVARAPTMSHLAQAR